MSKAKELIENIKSFHSDADFLQEFDMYEADATHKAIPVPPNNLSSALAWVKSGERLVVRSTSRTVIIDKKVLTKFEKAGSYLLKPEGKGYRMKSGNSSVYLLPGQLEYVVAIGENAPPDKPDSQ